MKWISISNKAKVFQIVIASILARIYCNRFSYILICIQCFCLTYITGRWVLPPPKLAPTRPQLPFIKPKCTGSPLVQYFAIFRDPACWRRDDCHVNFQLDFSSFCSDYCVSNNTENSF